ncbi:MAG: DUF6306 domain-containing protein, partial [Candidatus Binataceae bacterium]
MDKRLQDALNLLLESERSGVLALEELIREVEQEELRVFLRGSREEEARNVRELEALIRGGGGSPSDQTGPFAAKVAAVPTVRERLALMSRGQEWAARKSEDALAVAPPSGPIHDFLAAMAN